MKPWIIWAATRTASSALCLALRGENEPFIPGPPRNMHADRYDDWVKSRDSTWLESYCKSGVSFKHIPDLFDDEFNITIARLATSSGYKHIHLKRRNEYARLISDDIAGQLNAWSPHDARSAYADVLAGRRRLNLLDVPRLVKSHYLMVCKWNAVKPHLNSWLELSTEDFTKNQEILELLCEFVETPLTDEMKEILRQGNQDTSKIYHLVPNADELRDAVGKF